MSEERPNLSPDEFVDVTRVMDASVRLLLLDKYWTTEARRASEAGAGETGLESVVDEMQTLLLECRDLAPRLVTIAQRSDAGLRPRFEALVEGRLVESTGEKRARTFKRLREHVETNAGGDPAAYLATASEALQTEAEKEGQLLRAELDRIAAGNVSDGDMSQETAEHVAGIALGAGLLLGPEAAGAVIVVAEVIDCLF